MHTHISATAALSAFFAVLLMGTLWRLLAAHLVTSKSEHVSTIGKVMAFQY